MNSKKNINHAIIFIVDDVRAQDFFTLIEKNKLPNIKKLVNEGTYCDNCITSYPSITYPCYSNIVLGTYSDYFLKIGSGIPMYHFVDRNPSQ
ncbi:MAG: alkaline phosphatase family protein, partial [Promethearchaeota archaeon]